MKEFNLKDYNRLCAKFLGWDVPENDNSFYVEKFSRVFKDDNSIELEYHWFKVEDLLFNEDWNWIMEVVENIEINGGAACIGDNNTVILIFYISPENSYNKTRQLIGESKKEALVQVIWEFLNWYNENNTPNWQL